MHEDAAKNMAQELAQKEGKTYHVIKTDCCGCDIICNELYSKYVDIVIYTAIPNNS